MEPIAVIGFSFKLPEGAEYESSLWEILENGKNLMREWPESRVTLNGFYDQDSSKTNQVCSYDNEKGRVSPTE